MEYLMIRGFGAMLFTGSIIVLLVAIFTGKSTAAIYGIAGIVAGLCLMAGG